MRDRDLDEVLIRGMLHHDSGIARRAREMYNAIHGGDPMPPEAPHCAECFEGCPKCQPSGGGISIFELGKHL